MTDPTDDPRRADRARETEGVQRDRQLASHLFNEVRALLALENRTLVEDDRMVHAAHASRHHWEQVPVSDRSREALAGGEWQISRVYAVLGRAEPALHHARRLLELCEEPDIADWVRCFAYEALARAHAVAGDGVQARRFTDLALAAVEKSAKDVDAALMLDDLATIPGQSPYW